MHKTINNKYTFFNATAFIKEQSIFQPLQAYLKTVDFNILYIFLIMINILSKPNFLLRLQTNIFLKNQSYLLKQTYLLKLYMM